MRYSIVNYQSIVDSSHSLRFDAEFFHPDYLNIQHQLEKISSHRLIDFQVKIRHPKEIRRDYVDDGVLLIRGQNVRPLSIDLTFNPVYISEEDAESLKENTIHYKDILITRSGTTGHSAIYLENNSAISMSDVLIIQSGNLNPFFLTIFLNTKYGRTLIEKGRYGSVQTHIAPYFLYQIPMPIWDTLPPVIEKIYLRSRSLTELSKTRYTEAQTLLLAELGLTDWQPKQQLTFVKNFSDTEIARRTDADYYQPKYDEIVNAIKNYAGGWGALGNLATLEKCFEVGSQAYTEDGIPFVRVSNLSPFEITTEKYISKELYAEIEEHQPKQGEILFSKDATPGIAYYLREAPEKMIPAGGILRLQNRTDRINNEYLTLVLNSILTQEQVNRDVGGSVILHWRPDQVAGTVIPILHQEKQAEIEQKVVESFGLRNQAKDLLEHAKRAVEIAIEQNEQAAIEWLEDVSGITYYQKGDFDAAIAGFDEAIALNPADAEAYYNRGAAYAEKGEIDRAIADFDEAIALNPADAEAYYNRGAAYAEKGEIDRAIADFDEAIALNPADAEAYYLRGFVHSEEDDFDAAIEDFSKVIALNPADAEAYYNRGAAYVAKDDFDAAIEDFSKVIALNPADAEAYYNRGLVYSEEGDFDRKIQDYKKAIELSPEYAAVYTNLTQL